MDYGQLVQRNVVKSFAISVEATYFYLRVEGSSLRSAKAPRSLRVPRCMQFHDLLLGTIGGFPIIIGGAYLGFLFSGEIIRLVVYNRTP